MNATETSTQNTAADIEQLPTCAICLEENLEDPDQHHDDTGHDPVALPLYTTLTEALAGEILSPLEASGVASCEFDVEAIAALVLSDREYGYRRVVGHDRFWQTVGANVRQELPVHLAGDDRQDDTEGSVLCIGAADPAAAVESIPVEPHSDQLLWNARAAQRLQAAGWVITTVTPQGTPATVARVN